MPSGHRQVTPWTRQQTQRHKQPFTLTFTPQINLEAVRGCRVQFKVRFSLPLPHHTSLPSIPMGNVEIQPFQHSKLLKLLHSFLDDTGGVSIDCTSLVYSSCYIIKDRTSTEDGSVLLNAISEHPACHLIINSTLLLTAFCSDGCLFSSVYIIKMSSDHSEIFNSIMNLWAAMCCYSHMNSW